MFLLVFCVISGVCFVVLALVAWAIEHSGGGGRDDWGG